MFLSERQKALEKTSQKHLKDTMRKFHKYIKVEESKKVSNSN